MAALRPLAELTRRPRVLAFDVDDTVTRDGCVEACAIEALELARREGLRTVAITGRPLGWAEVIAWTWPVDVAVGENGAGWMWREGRALRFGHFHDATERASQRALLDAVTREVARVFPEVELAGDAGLRRCDVAWDVGETRVVPAARVAELVRCIEATGCRAPVSSVHAHAVPGAWNKARGAERVLAERFAIDASEAARACVFVGDSGNDAEAFAFFEGSVGVANVHENLGRIATPPRFVTSADRGRGFAELVAHLVGLPERA